MTTYSDGMTVATAYIIAVMAVTLLCLAGAVVWPRLTAMWAVVRLEWMEIRKGTRR